MGSFPASEGNPEPESMGPCLGIYKLRLALDKQTVIHQKLLLGRSNT